MGPFSGRGEGVAPGSVWWGCLALAGAAVPVILAMVNKGGRPPIDTPEEALKSEPRRAILTLVRRSPGITQLDIRKALGMGASSLDLHLSILAHVGLVETRRSGRFMCVFPAGEAPSPDDPALLPEGARAIARLVLHSPRTTSDLAAVTGFTQRNVLFYLDMLREAGLVGVDVVEGKPWYVPTNLLPEVAQGWRRR